MPQAAPSSDPTARAIAAGLLAWLIPGAGHALLGQRRYALILFVAISFPYLTGAAIGGVKSSVNPYLNKWLFLAELGCGGYTGPAFLLADRVGGLSARQTAEILNRSGPVAGMPPAQRQALEDKLLPYVSFYPASDVAQIYLAVAGLLNVLAILDAIARALTGNRPVFYHELVVKGQLPPQEGEPA